MDNGTNVGHLVTIRNTSTDRKEFVFLFITGDEPTDAYKKVIQGIRNLRLPPKLRAVTHIQADTVTDFSKMEREHPETTGRKIHRLPVISFFDSKNQAFKKNLFLNGVINIIQKNGDFFPANRLAAVATGSDFFDREREINTIWKHIQKGRNVLLRGPRRYGKTSMMRAIKDSAVEQGLRPVMIDLESVFTPQEFVAKIWVEVESPNITETEKNKKAQKMEDSIEDLWPEEGEKVFKKISKAKENILFLLDECPYMLDSFLGKDDTDREEIDTLAKEKANQFIKWFSKQRDQCKNRCIFLLTGSVNLKPYLKDNGLDKDSFTDCKEVRLTLFDSETVRTYLECLLLGKGIFLPHDMIRELVRMTTPGIPYFIQIVMNHVVSLYRKNPHFSVEDLRETYQEEIIGPGGRRQFDTFERHFKRYGSRKPGASAMLGKLSNAGDHGLLRRDLENIYRGSSGLSGASEFDIILGYLEYDFYIEKIKGTDRYRFASPMLRDYWQKNQR